jgi:HEAT repeat protein
MRARIALTLAVGWAALGGAAGAQQQKPAKLSEADAKRVAELIRQLDAKKFRERDKAMKALTAYGEPVLPALEKAVKGPVSLETQRRLNAVIWTLRAPARAEEAKRVAALIGQLNANSFEVREAALKALAAVGRPALSQLYAATFGPDPETARRAEAVIVRILKKA